MAKDHLATTVMDQAVVADEQAATADTAMDQYYTEGDESTRCGPHWDDQAIPVRRAETVMCQCADQLEDCGGEASPEFLRYVAKELRGAACLMRHVRGEEGATPATQLDPTQATQATTAMEGIDPRPE